MIIFQARNSEGRCRHFGLLCALLFLPSITLGTEIIEKIPSLQPVSIIYVRALAAYRGQSVNWKVTGSTIDEVTGVFAATDTIVGSGDSVRVLAIKYANKYSFYKITAGIGAQKDSLELQAFTKGSVQLFLFKSPSFPTKPIPVHIYLPASFSPSSAIVAVMHGVDRNAYSYALSWTSYAAANNTVLMAPEFNATDWTSDAYSLGNMFTGSDGQGSLNPKEKWTFTLVTNIERTISRGLGLKDSSYIIWGHSAGAQFVHRKILFSYDPLITTAISANAGWYTAPDAAIAYPWGISHPFLTLSNADLLQFVSRNLVLMRGTADTIRDSNLNTDPLSDAQGKNRYQRAGYFFQKGKDVSSALNWRLLDVAGSAHEYQKMAAAAGDFLVKGSNAVERISASPERMRLLHSYPNPFNPSTTIVFSLSHTARATVEVYSLLGQKVQTLTDEEYLPGSYTVRFDGTALSSGMYVCRYSDGQQTMSIKLLLQK
ncbi:MAG: T9SS type A sorting domain-containing protein [Ignavibacteriales bacterium]|nr:T9SS type A sorting domain-containing protein [Ignavibacteriales bacterium]